MNQLLIISKQKLKRILVLSLILGLTQISAPAMADDAADLAAATASVVTAEGSELQADVDAAQLLVTALPDGADKTALQDRIDIVQGIIDAAVVPANDNSDDGSWKNKVTNVPILPTSTQWLNLSNNVLKVNFATQNKGKIVKIYNNQNGITVLVGFTELDKFGNATITLKKKVLPGSLFAMIGKQIKNVIRVA